MDAWMMPIHTRFKDGIENFHERYSKVANTKAFYDSSGMRTKMFDWSNK